jgi:hypothetical protein
MPLLLPMLLVPCGCGVAAWQDPLHAIRTPRDGAGAGSKISPEARRDARPRPHCRPAAAPSSR